MKGLQNLGGAMILALYSYLGYYHVCYIGDEVRDPGRTIPRAIILSALTVCLLFVGVHLALLTGNDMFNNAYGPFTVDSVPKVPTSTFNNLSDVAPAAFWSPYN